MPRLRSHIGDQVKYKPPLSARKQGAPNRIGRIEDEVWAIDAQRDPPKHDHNDPNCWGDYAFCSQLIKWDEGGSIRLTFYRLPCGESRCKPKDINRTENANGVADQLVYGEGYYVYTCNRIVTGIQSGTAGRAPKAK
jgi:hypothetical protein